PCAESDLPVISSDSLMSIRLRRRRAIPATTATASTTTTATMITIRVVVSTRPSSHLLIHPPELAPARCGTRSGGSPNRVRNTGRKRAKRLRGPPRVQYTTTVLTQRVIGMLSGTSMDGVDVAAA